MLPARMMVQMFLRLRKYPACEEFSFRPHLCRLDRRFVAVDVCARDGGFDRTLRLRPGSTDIEVFAQIFLYGHYRTQHMARHAEIVAYYASCAKPLVLDLGANIGLSALYFAKNWPKAMIVGIEPDEGNYALFTQNTAGQEQIVPVRAAIASRHSYARIVNPDEPAWAYQTEIDDHNRGGLAAIPVTELLECYRNCEPFICKIDIEGAEQELFSANTEWIDRFPIVIIELHDWLFPRSGNSANFLRVIAGMDRDFLVSGPNVFSIDRRMGSVGEIERRDPIPIADRGRAEKR